MPQSVNDKNGERQNSIEEQLKTQADSIEEQHLTEGSSSPKNSTYGVDGHNKK